MAMNKQVNIKINGISYSVDSGLTVLKAAKVCGYYIPSLCTFKDDQCNVASCRVCLVEIKGFRGLTASCITKVADGMEITLDSPKVLESRKNVIELILSNHSNDCQTCHKNEKCELLHVANMVGAEKGRYYGAITERSFDDLSTSIVRDTSKCILCGRCIARCKEVQGIGVLDYENRGFDTILSPAGDRSFKDSPCILCGQCITVCPTGALSEKDEIYKLDQAIKDGKYIVVQTAPAVRATIAEEFAQPIGTDGTAKMVAALRRLGFKKVWDTDYAADLTILEEANELLERVNNKGVLPMITSCSPGWINYLEYYYPDIIPNVSSCKSPHEMMGAVIKSYFAEKNGIDPKDIYVVSIMPCTAKKYEISKPEQKFDNLQGVDLVLTVRELARLIKRNGIDWKSLPENETFDQDLFGETTGAAVIFGVTGGVMEAAVRTAYYKLTSNELPILNLKPVRGFKGIKSTSLNVNGLEINVAVAHGIANAIPILQDIRAGKSKYHFIEIMGCPGGCINGGGQPFVKPQFLPHEKDDIQSTYLKKRANVLYDQDKSAKVRQSHNNKDIISLYDNFLGEPGSHKAHHLLHTTYNRNRVKFPLPQSKEA
jgi:NADP-reducing hydrogenase subunit HndD